MFLTVLFWFSVVFIGLLVLSVLPGFKNVIVPLLSLISNAAGFLFKSVGAWLAFLVTTIWRSHVTLFNHLIKPIEELDKTRIIKGR